ncbi:MAG: DUF2493 domain-containing protein [Ruminococcaceae bacterium]|nr:DUF2493 domain-containing protein [Oscillospiraceae bacterium]
MKLAIIGSRTLAIQNISGYIPDNVTEIVSGGAKGIDTAAAEYAKQNGIKLTVFLPQYEKYHRAAPLIRNKQIADYADCALALWDGKSKGTIHTVKLFETQSKPVTIIQITTKTG